ncbi:hypothetical protein G5V59_07295 [Nocardioides sp. W3-2-3]|uniref:hypothetical protein n=1 Tax=Nocardioides convexus TaxID=2712224 RepID=UPI002418B8AE|nr:hypothetical protein [Nocardioides convexus]NHA00054.1 hypothetical protein [Nocardioides convexus]
MRAILPARRWFVAYGGGDERRGGTGGARQAGATGELLALGVGAPYRTAGAAQGRAAGAHRRCGHPGEPARPRGGDRDRREPRLPALEQQPRRRGHRRPASVRTGRTTR